MDTSSSETEDPSSPILPTPPPDDDDVDDDEDAFEILSRVSPSPDTVPWEQRSTKMKVVHVADRVFISFLAVVFLILVGEVVYTLYHAVPWQAIFQALRDRLLMQEEDEEDLDL